MHNCLHYWTNLINFLKVLWNNPHQKSYRRPPTCKPSITVPEKLFDKAKHCKVPSPHIIKWHHRASSWLRWRIKPSFPMHNQIKFDLRFTDLQSTWCSELMVNQLCFVFSIHFWYPITWSMICWLAINWVYFMPIWLADSDLDLQCCAKLPSMHC